MKRFALLASAAVVVASCGSSEAGLQITDARIGQPLAKQTLEFSFRSSDAILRLVDQTFKEHEHAGFVTDQLHRAFHTDKPGRVDLWPVLDQSTDKERPDWTDPVGEARWIGERLGVEPTLVDGAGHYPQTEMPHVTNPQIVQFLKQVK